MFPLIELATSLINKLFPDKTKAAELQAQLLQMQAEGSLKEIEAKYNLAGQQIDVDKQEASVGQSLTGWQAFFVSAWRPSVAWCCVFALAYSFIVMPFIQTGLAVFDPSFDVTKLPKLDWSILGQLLMGLLGLGAMRTYEKVNGINAGQ